MKRQFQLLLCTSFGSIFAYPAVADKDEQALASVFVGLTQTNLFSSDNSIESTHEASLDIVTELASNVGVWVLYVEGNTTPQANGVSSVIEGSNADSGTALNAQDKGRLQVSELSLNRSLTNGAFRIGIIDLTAVFDTSDVANDETAQFLSSELVNNASIPFPDYTLGTVYTHTQLGEYPLTLHAAMTSSNGLSDNPNKNYTELLDVFTGEKGMFAISELVWNKPMTTRIGAWHHSAVYPENENRKHAASGLYTSIESSLSTWAWNIRLGASLEENHDDWFASASIDHPIGPGKLGVGSSISLTEQGSEKTSNQLVEGYYRYQFGSIDTSVSLQWRNQQDTEPLWLAALRFYYSY